MSEKQPHESDAILAHSTPHCRVCSQAVVEVEVVRVDELGRVDERLGLACSLLEDADRARQRGDENFAESLTNNAVVAILEVRAALGES